MAGTDAACTDFHAPHAAVTDRFHLLQVGVPDPARFVVCMADVVTEAGAFAAYFTYLGHSIVSSLMN